MRLEILGPIRASVDGQETMLRAGLERALLASLLLQANRTVPFERQVAALWDDATPRNPREKLHSCMSRLRRRALAGSRQIQLRAGQARALNGMAQCLRESDPAAARRHWQQALYLFRDLDHPEQYEVERQLAGGPDGPG